MVTKLLRIIFFILIFFPLTLYAYTAADVAAIKVFLQQDIIVSAKQLDNLPYVVAQEGEHLMTGMGDKVYVRGLDISAYQKHFALFRTGNAYLDPETKKVLGYEGTFIGDGFIEKIADPATLFLNESAREVHMGDRLIPSDKVSMDLNFRPNPTQFPINGQVIAIKDGESNFGSYQVVILNKGENQGIKIGDLLGVYKKSQLIDDPYTKNKKEKIKTPREYEGKLLIFRCFDSMSIGLVVYGTSPMKVGDEVANL